ncbi:hypothetical protein [Thiohalophilus thiocyanatoxydans]|uniref:Uncharacterized protein n=1 Tax=Thiohalophilus thiocyanatoxydans TaxID=381308 RepID=A0A4R8IU45_9GAMM|nr:hypothetical protein [Thiohalophilus thiocyanatoxydans]TDY02960.1 hypothetical protein EDC23_1344 [Thiohalophilus thiocyanatoxydans]
MKSLLVIGLALLLGGCNTTPNELDALDKVLRAYEHSIRWSRLELAGQYYKDPPTFSKRDKERLKEIKVTGYKVMDLRASKTEAVHLVEISYFNTNNAVEKEFTDTQQWEYDGEAERWQLTSDFPEFK